MRHWATRHTPMVDRRTNCVVGWTFLLHLEDRGVTAFDEMAMEAKPLRPIHDWSQREVAALVEQAYERHPRAQHLKQILEQRINIRAVERFELTSLKEA